MRVFLAAVAMLILAVSAPPAIAQSRLDSSQKTLDLPTVAADYAHNASITDRFMIETGRLGVSRARADEIRNFARTVFDSHTASFTDLKAVLSQAGLPPPAAGSLGKGPTGMLDGLQQASTGSKDFDDRFLSTSLESHRLALALHENYAANGDNELLRAHAARSAKMIAAHLELLKNYHP